MSSRKPQASSAPGSFITVCPWNVNGTFPDQRAVTPVAAASQTSAVSGEPMFRSLYQAGERTQPISPTVQELWGKVASATPEVRAPGRLDLFSDRNGTFSS